MRSKVYAIVTFRTHERWYTTCTCTIGMLIYKQSPWIPYIKIHNIAWTRLWKWNIGCRSYVQRTLRVENRVPRSSMTKIRENWAFWRRLRACLYGLLIERYTSYRTLQYTKFFEKSYIFKLCEEKIQSAKSIYGLGFNSINPIASKLIWPRSIFFI